MVKGEESFKFGEKIIIGALILQCLIFGFFVIVAARFHRKALQAPTERMKDSSFLPWQKHLTALYISSGLILTRSIFRVIEYGQGNNGYLLQHEYFFYIFDACLMFGVMLVFNIVHPSEVKALLVGGKASVNAGIRLQAFDKV